MGIDRAAANKRLQLAVNFLNADLETGREGDILNAKDDLRNFMMPAKFAPAVVGAVQIVLPENVLPTDKDALLAVQGAGRQLFSELVKMRDQVRIAKREHSDGSGFSLPEGSFFRVDAKARWFLFTFEARGQVSAFAYVDTLRDGFLTLLIYLVLNSDTGDIRSCPVCHRLFVRTGRQEYDSPRCAGVASSRKWRDEQKRKSARKK